MAGLVAAVSLEGCGLLTKSYDFTEAENSIYVEDNATIRAAMISDFDKDYYRKKKKVFFFQCATKRQ